MRGGAGRGQGRKPAEPDLYRRMLIGARCEEVRREYSDKGAQARLTEVWETLETARAGFHAERQRRHTRVEQLKSAGLKKSAKDEAKKFADWETGAKKQLATAARIARGRKHVVISLKRYRPKPLTRAQIYQIVAKESGASPRRVRDYWIEHNKSLSSAKLAEPSTNAHIDDNL